MKCPYNPRMNCRYVDSSTMTTDKPCEECECYNRGLHDHGCLGDTVTIATAIAILILTLTV